MPDGIFLGAPQRLCREDTAGNKKTDLAEAKSVIF
jgi:hypothetical protein